ncbi:MAG: iron-sulfur cluster assembly scaffold protein [archaeon]
MYSDEVMEHFTNPKNKGVLKDYDAVGKVGNPTCGDVMEVFIKVKNNRIDKISFRTFGCAAAIATSSVVTELAKGKTLEEAEKITKDDVIKKLGDLPAMKIHCSILAQDALRVAIKHYKEKNKKKK